MRSAIGGSAASRQRRSATGIRPRGMPPATLRRRGGNRGKDLAQALSRGRARGDRRQRPTARSAICSRSRAPSTPTRPAFTCMGKSITFGELDTLSAAFGAWLQANGCKKGARVALMMPNVLQYPVCLFGVAARRLHRRQRQSALHAARARAPAQGFGRRSDRHRRELRAHAAGGDRQDQDQASSSSPPMGELLGLQGPGRQLRGAEGQEDGPGVQRARLDAAFRRAGATAAGARSSRCRSATTTSPSCSTPAAPPASPRARCCCTATSSPTCCRRGPG